MLIGQRTESNSGLSVRFNWFEVAVLGRPKGNDIKRNTHLFDVGAHMATAMWMMFLPPSPCSLSNRSALSSGLPPETPVADVDAADAGGADTGVPLCASEASPEIFPSAPKTTPPPMRLRRVLMASISERRMCGIRSCGNGERVRNGRRDFQSTHTSTQFTREFTTD